MEHAALDGATLMRLAAVRRRGCRSQYVSAKAGAKSFNQSSGSSPAKTRTHAPLARRGCMATSVPAGQRRSVQGTVILRVVSFCDCDRVWLPPSGGSIPFGNDFGAPPSAQDAINAISNADSEG